MKKKFRESEFIDFNTGTVKLAPIQLQFRLRMAGNPPFADLVRLFQCRVEVWHLGVAAQMLHEIEYSQPPGVWSHAAYGLLSLLFTYFETVGKVVNQEAKADGSGPSNFECGFFDVYARPTTSSGGRLDPNEFYNRARNGLFHLGSTQQGLWVHNERSISPQDFDIIQRSPADPTSRKYYINPHTTTRTIVDHFPTLIARLNDPNPRHDPLRANFKEMVGDVRAG